MLTLPRSRSLRRTATATASHLVTRLEVAEGAAWADLYRAAGDGVETTRLRTGLVGATTLLAVPESDVLALNRAVGLGAYAPATEDDIDAVMTFFAEARVSRYFVQVSPAAQPYALDQRLLARGFRHHNNWVKLVRSLRRMPDLASPFRIERLGPDHAHAFADLIPEAFDWPGVMREPLAATVGRGPWKHYAAFDGSEPVAAAALFVAGDTAYFGPAVTCVGHRGRGAQSALIARRLHDAAALGATFAVVETAEEHPERPVVQSFRNLRRLGFEVAYVRPNYLFDA